MKKESKKKLKHLEETNCLKNTNNQNFNDDSKMYSENQSEKNKDIYIITYLY